MGAKATGRGWARGQRMSPEQPMSPDRAAARALATIARAYVQGRATKGEVSDAAYEWLDVVDPLAGKARIL